MRGRGFAPIAILLIIAAILVTVGGLFYYKTNHPSTAPKTTVTFSPAFTPPSNSPQVNILTPASGTQWTVGSTQTIKWAVRNQNALSLPYVSIILVGYPQHPCGDVTCPLPIYLTPQAVATNRTPNIGSFSWTVGYDVNGKEVPTGQYKLSVGVTDGRIVCIDNEPCSTSGNFAWPAETNVTIVR